MATNASRKRASAADIAAAVALGTIDPSMTFASPAELDAAAKSAELAAQSSAAAADTARVALSADHHECGIAGCRHGATAHGVTQPDRQLKLAAPCGAVIRLTQRALGAAGGLVKCGHGDPFTIAERRTYRRRSA